MIPSILASFLDQIRDLRNLDSQNQLSLSNGNITNGQLALLTEAVFFSAFRIYENFLRDAFLNYCCGEVSSSGIAAQSYLKPRDTVHAELLIQSGMKFLDWSTPTQILERAESYLVNGAPVKLPISTKQHSLLLYKRLRNHIAHRSKESLEEYKKVLIHFMTTVPLTIPDPGVFLLWKKPSKRDYILLIVLKDLEDVAREVCK